MKYFVSSDIHGFYDEWMNSLWKSGFDKNNKEHAIIVCGDLLDRGEQPIECLQFVNEMHEQGRAILIRGNHEDLMEKAIARHEFWSHDVSNGTVNTAYIITGAGCDDEALDMMKTNELWNKYIGKCVDYAEIGDYIFVHGWIPVSIKYSDDEAYKYLPDMYKPIVRLYNSDWRNATFEEWKEARWLNGMKMWSEGIREYGKTIWCGHIHSSWGHANLHSDGVEYISRIATYCTDPNTGKIEPHMNNDSFIDDGIVCLDTMTVKTKRVNVEMIEI